MTPDEFEKLVDHFEHVLLSDYANYTDSQAKRECERVIAPLGASDSAYKLGKAIDWGRRNEQHARSMIFQVRMAIPNMKDANRIW